MQRRAFLKNSLALAAVLQSSLNGSETPTPSSPPKPKRPVRPKALTLGSLRGPTAQAATLREKFEWVKTAGFAGIEIPSGFNQSEVLAACAATGLRIPSVMTSTHWTHPLTSPSPGIREKGLAGLQQALHDAKAYGAASVLLVPGIVNHEVSYTDAYRRSADEIRKALPLAASLDITIAIENVWNHFLLSPLEAAAYVDAFRSPFVRWHFDVGNAVNTGWPEHWIRALGDRIVQVHVKEYSRTLRDEKGPRAGFAIDLLEGDNNWPAVMRALDEVGYAGWLIAEQYRPPALAGASDAEWLAHLSRKLDEINAA